jgi:hypothetical protein
VTENRHHLAELLADSREKTPSFLRRSSSHSNSKAPSRCEITHKSPPSRPPRPLRPPRLSPLPPRLSPLPPRLCYDYSTTIALLRLNYYYYYYYYYHHHSTTTHLMLVLLVFLYVIIFLIHLVLA